MTPVLTLTFIQVEGQGLLHAGHMGQGRRRVWDVKTGAMLYQQEV